MGNRLGNGGPNGYQWLRSTQGTGTLRDRVLTVLQAEHPNRLTHEQIAVRLGSVWPGGLNIRRETAKLEREGKITHAGMLGVGNSSVSSWRSNTRALPVPAASSSSGA